MDKKFKIAAVAVPFATLTAITIAFAISGKPKTEAGELQPTSVSAPTAKQLNKNEKADSRKAVEGNDGEEDDDAPIAAKITPEQAKVAALTVQPGVATKTELENEDGKPVYGVDITATDKQKYEVEVDGNTGKVLKIGIEKDDEGDGDGEENDD